MAEPLRYILVGTGGWGGAWCAHFLPRLIELGKAVPAAAVDLDSEHLQNAVRHLGIPEGRCYTDLARALDENPADFAIVVVPPAHHESVVDAALAHGLHILSEKPIADSMEGCCRIYQKVKAAGKKMAVTMSHRFDQDKQSLEQAIRSGDYGRLNYVVCRFTHNCRRFGSWGEFRHRIPDPLLIEGTVHHFDCLRALSGANARSVYARTWNPPWGEFAGDSTGLVTLEMENGVHCFYEGAKANASTMNGWTNEYFRAECENGTLELDRRWLRVLRGDGGERPLAQDLPLLQQPVWMNQWLAELFVDWLQGGPQPPNHLDDNLQCCALLFAAVESAHTGRPVDVQEHLREHLEGSLGR
ncbi:MAG TPA: Gfo/Idh/MocA family oxidoreductase [Armatimonadota bacterium]